MINLMDLKPNDIIGLVVCDYADGEAVVREVSEDKVKIQWIYRTPCYSGTYFANADGIDEISAEDVENGNVFDLVILERTREKKNPWVITEYQMEQMVDSYNANKEDLENLESYIKENGCTDDGLSDVAESFEQGWNNALKYVFSLLNINID